jgi:hypothetical protein
VPHTIRERGTVERPTISTALANYATSAVITLTITITIAITPTATRNVVAVAGEGDV